MLSQLFYFFTLVCVLSQANLYVSGSFLGDLLRAGGNANYQLADVSDDAVNTIRDMFQPPVNIYGKRGTGVGGRLDGNIGYNIDVIPPRSYDFYRSFAPSGSVGGQVDIGASLPSASGALLTPENTRRTRFFNVQQGTPPIFRYFEN